MNSPNTTTSAADDTNKPVTPVVPIVNAPGDKPAPHGPAPAETPAVKADAK